MNKEERIEIKAKALVKEFWVYNGEGVMDYPKAIGCALICIERQLRTLSEIDTSFNDDIAEEVYQQELELGLIKKAIKKL